MYHAIRDVRFAGEIDVRALSQVILFLCVWGIFYIDKFWSKIHMSRNRKQNHLWFAKFSIEYISET